MRIRSLWSLILRQPLPALERLGVHATRYEVANFSTTRLLNPLRAFNTYQVHSTLLNTPTQPRLFPAGLSKNRISIEGTIVLQDYSYSSGNSLSDGAIKKTLDELTEKFFEARELLDDAVCMFVPCHQHVWYITLLEYIG